MSAQKKSRAYADDAVAILLMVTVITTHYGANWIADKTGYSPAAVFYMLQGLSGAILAAVLLLFIVPRANTLSHVIAISALVIAIIEESQVPLWRLAVNDISAVPRGMNLGEYVTGLPVTFYTIAVEVCVTVALIALWLTAQDDDS